MRRRVPKLTVTSVLHWDVVLGAKDEVTQLNIESPTTCYASDNGDAVESSGIQNVEEERERLVSLVHQFTKVTLEGVPCNQLEHYGDEALAPCIFRCLPDIQSFEVIPSAEEPSVEGQNASRTKVEIDVANICDVYSWPDLLRLPKLSNVAKCKSLQRLPDEERKRLVVIEFMDRHQYSQRLCLLVPYAIGNPKKNETIADVFATVLRMLQLHARMACTE